MNTFFEASSRFMPYSLEHGAILIGFISAAILLVNRLKREDEEVQRKVLFGIAVILAVAQLAKIPLNLLTDRFDVTKDIPLHMCNFLPFVMIGIYATKSKLLWATTFFWVILGVSQANFTPSIEYSLFYYDAVRYWLVHLGLVLLALYPAIVWKWTLVVKDIASSILALNAIAVVIYFANLVLDSNYLYIMAKPPGTTFFSMLPPYPTYILVLEGIIVIWAFMLVGIFRLIEKNRKRKTISRS